MGVDEEVMGETEKVVEEEEEERGEGELKVVVLGKSGEEGTTEEWWREGR